MAILRYGEALTNYGSPTDQIHLPSLAPTASSATSVTLTDKNGAVITITGTGLTLGVGGITGGTVTAIALFAPGGVSLYVGAGVAELPALITEVLDLGRTVRASNLRAVEVEVVNHAMAAHGLPELLVCADARELSPSHDHLNMVSVLSDPETFPMVSGIAYGRLHPVHVDVDELVRERADVEALVDGVCRGLSLPGLITTTVEEVPWLLAWAEAKGFVIEPDEAMIETAIVGDPIGFLRVQARPSA